ncbi:MAG: LacI family DNA-binding transcriptional regulator [Anaerolineae bacterium]|nr:LacI family DNA-binding transcriptional regulator [Anaerolineae bacterium]
MARTRRSVTIIDVAKAAGVGVSTVSRVINNKGYVSEETHQRVSEVIDDLGYAQNLAARSMRSQQTNLIGLIMPDVTDPFCIELMRGVSRAIIELDYDLIIYTNGDIRRNDSNTRMQQYVSILNSSVADGVIIVIPLADDFPPVSPVVSIDLNINHPSGPAVIATNYQGVREAIDHLFELGHRRIGYIGGRMELMSGVQRQKAFEDAFKEAGLPLDDRLMLPGEFTFSAGYQRGLELLSLDEPPTAIFASNDQAAKGVYQAASELGFRIPDDLSVVGFDNIPEAAYMGLTTVDQHVEQMGYMGTKMLYRLIQEDDPEEDIYQIETTLVVRGSCQPFDH